MLAALEQISKNYEFPVLRNISLTIGQGDSVAIVGPSGSGKTTLLNILGTLDRPSSGKVIIDGQQVDKLKDDQLSLIRNRCIGFVFQLHHLLPQLTLLENALLPVLPRKDKTIMKEAVKQAHRLFERVQLCGLENRLPAMVSVGECQRAALVRGLINKPGLLLADEPTGSLDEAHALALGELMAELNREEGMGLVVVTHSMELAGLMKRRYRLHSGKLDAI